MRLMRLHKLAIALTAVTFAGAAAAAGNANDDMANKPSNDQMTTRQTSPQSTQRSEASTPMGSTQSKASQGSTSGEEQNPATVRSAQQALKQKGFDVGSIDGQMGPSTQSALRSFQQSQGLPQTGNLDQQTLSALGADQDQAGASNQGAASTSGAAPMENSSSPGASSSQGAPNSSATSGQSTQSSAYK